MSDLVKFVAFALFGVAIGYLSAQYMARGNAGSGAARIGAWTVWPRAGAADASPYSRLHFFLSGQMPPSHFNRLEYEAAADDAGRPLEAACSYLLEGPMPAVRWWALSAYQADGRNSEAALAVTELSSFDAIYDGSGRLRIHVDRLARQGNWLPLPTKGRFVLVLRMFNASALSRDGLLAKVPLSIVREACR